MRERPTAVGPALFRTSRPGKSSIIRCRINRLLDPSVPDRYSPARGCLGPGIHVLGPMFHTWAVLSQPVWRILSIQPPTCGRVVDGRRFPFAVALGPVEPGGLGLFRGGHQPRSRRAVGHRRAGGLGGSAAWAGTKWLAYFSAPLLPMLGVALAVLPILVLGLLMRSDLLAVLAALIWPLVLVGGFVMTILLLGVLLGWPLMWATISVEGTDSFDALNRTYSYVFQRPLRYFFYVIVAAVIGWLGWIVVENFAASVIWLASWAASWGAGSARIQELTAGSGRFVAGPRRDVAHRVLGRVGKTAGHRLFVQLLRRRLDGHLLSASPRRRRAGNRRSLSRRRCQRTEIRSSQAPERCRRQRRRLCEKAARETNRPMADAERSS